MTWFAWIILASFPQQDGQTADKGPIHEAFAQPAESKIARGPLLSMEPPAPIREEPPEDKPEGDKVAWIDGYWSFDNDRDGYLWISGFWRQTPPGQQWVPGRFEKERGGWRWYSGYWQAVELVEQEPEPDQPPDSLDIGPTIPAPRPGMAWAPGFHVRRDRAWLWRPGTWIACNPGWVWNPGRWILTRRGFVFVQGYWDYPLECRGVIYTPVYYAPAVIARPGFCHRPSMVIVTNDLSCGLFSRPGCGSYHFGNYFTPAYASQGFVFWATPRPMGRPDPLFAYYAQARDRAWVERVRDYGRLRVEGKPATAPTLALVSATGPKAPAGRSAGDHVRLVAAGQQGKVTLKNTAAPPPRTAIPASQIVARPVKPATVPPNPGKAVTDGPMKEPKGKESPKVSGEAVKTDPTRPKPNQMPPLPKGKDAAKDATDKGPPKAKDIPGNKPMTRNPVTVPPKENPMTRPPTAEPVRAAPPTRPASAPAAPMATTAKPLPPTAKPIQPNGAGGVRQAPLKSNTGEPEKKSQPQKTPGSRE